MPIAFEWRAWQAQEEGEETLKGSKRCRLKPIIATATMLKRHLLNLLNYHRLTNATTEGLNLRIQAIKADARGFRSFQNFRVRILFFLGKLDLSPGKVKGNQQEYDEKKIEVYKGGFS